MPPPSPFPNTLFLFTCPRQTFESCRPISPPNLPEPAQSSWPVLTLSDLCREEAFRSLRQSQTPVGRDSSGGPGEAQAPVVAPREGIADLKY